MQVLVGAGVLIGCILLSSLFLGLDFPFLAVLFGMAAVPGAFIAAFFAGDRDF